MPAESAKRIQRPLLDEERLRAMIDRESTYLIYATLSGDCVKTAHAIGVPPAAILKISEEEGWDVKLKGIIELAKSQTPGSLERACNRAINFVQAHKLRVILERLLRELTSLSDAELACRAVEQTAGKDGAVREKFNVRAFTDLSKAIESCHAMTYAALQDHASDRAKRNEADTGTAVVDLHASIAAAMAKAGSSNSPRSVLLSAQLAQANELAEKAVKPASPYDDKE